MGTRPKEIQQLVDWLREPGRTLIGGRWKNERGDCCTGQKLYEISGLTCRDDMLTKIGIEAEQFTDLIAFNDEHYTAPTVVAEYLEREFPA